MIVRLPFGNENLVGDLRGLRCREIAGSAPRHAAPVRELVAGALDRPLAGAPLAELARGRRRVTLLVPDGTRRAHLPEVLPEVLARLDRAGVSQEGVAILVACGTHPSASAAELAGLLGPLRGGVEVIQHDCRDVSALVAVGTVPGGVAVRLHRRAVDCDLLVSASVVQHHYIAGFGGGPKMVFPGVAGYEEIQSNHARVIDLGETPPRRHPGCEPGILDGNPVAEEIAAAAALRPVDLALVMVAGAAGAPAWAAAGPLAGAYPAACAKTSAWHEVDAGPFDRVVAAAGGAPSDQTLIQAHKALDAACRYAGAGGEVLFVASCRGGLGSAEMERFLDDPRPEAIVASLSKRYVQYGHTTLRIVEKTSKFRVLARTELPAGVVRRLGMEPVASLDAVLDRWREEASGAVVGVMAGGAVYPTRCGAVESPGKDACR